MKNIDFESLGIRIKDIRTQKNITQDQLAEMIGSDRAVIARIENPAFGRHSSYIHIFYLSLEDSYGDTITYATISVFKVL